MQLTLINGNGRGEDEVAVHATGCRDIAKYRFNNMYTKSYSSQREAFLDYNEEFIYGNDESNAWPLTFKNCCKGLPK